MSKSTTSHRKKDLYLSKSKTMKELNGMVDITAESKNPKLMLKSGDKLYAEGKKAILDGDEERAYILFMRFMDNSRLIQKSQEYLKDKGYYDKMMGNNKVLEVLKCAEELSDSLTKRYQLVLEAEKLDANQNDKDIKEGVESEKNRIDSKKSSLSKSIVPGKNGVIKPSNKNQEISNEKSGNISPAQLKNLVDQKSLRFLLIDCRGYHDFLSAHLSHTNCINIPAESLTPGMSGNKIGETMKKDSSGSYIEWTKRSEFDRIILYDWNSSFENMQPTMSVLYDAITKWDPETKYKSPPTVLQGGIRNVYYTYPTLINKPLNVSDDPATKQASSDSPNFKDLDSISYPNLDDDDDRNTRATSASPSSKIVNDLGKVDLNPKNSINNNSSGNISKTTPITIDRSTKPSVMSFTKVPNGPSSNHLLNDEPNSRRMTNGLVNGISSVNKLNNDQIEGKRTALTLAYDDAIRNNKEVSTLEEEVKLLEIKALKTQNEALIESLNKKQKELEEYEIQMVNKDENLKILQDELNSAIEQGAKDSKSTLPPVRVKVDPTLQQKLKEKERLDEYVKKLREDRKKREQAEKNASDLKLPSISSSKIQNQPKTSNSTSNSIPLPSINSSESTRSNVPSSDPIAIKHPSKPSNSATGLLRPMSQDASPMTFQKLKEEPFESPRSGLLKRSHSHPNIAQSLNEEDISSPSGSVPSQTPNFNRNLKPVNNRQHVPEISTPTRPREFHAVSSSDKYNRTGLKNLGNSCYMSSIMQCLNSLPNLIEYFFREEQKMVLGLTKDRVRTRGEISTEIGYAIKEMNVGHRSISLHCLKNIIGKYHSNFYGNDQQDSHEFLTFILDWLHEELNVKKKVPLKEQTNDNLSDDNASEIAWNDYISSNCSRIIDLFCGQQRSCVQCQTCFKESVTYETFFNLSVPIPNTTKKVDVQQCIDLYTSAEEIMDWNCVHCKGTRKAKKKIDLWKLPSNLIIHFQRFFYDGWWKKRLTEIDFQIDNLDLTSKVKGNGKTEDGRTPRYSYDLMAVSNHYGTMEGGHYTAYCRKGQGWAKFDDADVQSISPRDVVTTSAYILFYSNNSP